MKMKKSNLMVMSINCKYCNAKLVLNISRPTKIFCNKKCRDTYWRINHPEKWAKYQKKCRLKIPVVCRYCKNSISNDKRGCGITYCSDICRRTSRLSKSRLRDKGTIEVFGNLKIKCGCCNPDCLYNRFAIVLDFHHIDPLQKDCRITHKDWHLKYNEIKKCVLLCKNCHYECHHYMKYNIEKYNKFIKNCSKLQNKMLDIFKDIY